MLLYYVRFKMIPKPKISTSCLFLQSLQSKRSKKEMKKKARLAKLEEKRRRREERDSDDDGSSSSSSSSSSESSSSSSSEEDDVSGDESSLVARFPESSEPIEEFAHLSLACLLLLWVKQHIKAVYGVTDK